MLAFVIVIHRRVGADLAGDRFEAFFRHRHRGQRAGADALGREHRADTADDAALLPAAVTGDHRFGVQSVGFANRGKRRRAERKALLVIVEQGKFAGLGGELPGVHGFRTQSARRGW